MFENLNEMSLCDIESPPRDLELPVCTIYINNPIQALTEKLLKTCSWISDHQAVSDLRMKAVRCEYLTVLDAPIKMSRNPQSVCLRHCALPHNFSWSTLRQLKGCGDSLQVLQLRLMYLAPFESLLDELLEDLVAHHKAGLAQKKLLMWLEADKDTSTKLSEEFVEKWRNRCEKVDSIRCYIRDYYYCLFDYPVIR